MKACIGIRTLTAALALAVVSSFVPSSARAAAWSGSALWSTWSNGGYVLHNNIWGAGHGPQTLWANSYSNWGVWANHPNTAGIKAYPNCTKYFGKKLGAVSTCKSSFNITVPSGGAWTATYDVWDSANQHEIMLWMNYTNNPNGSGNIKPISSKWNASGNPVAVYTNVSVGGHTWNVFKGSNGKNNVYSFLRTSKTSSGTVDLKAIMNWIKARGWFGDITVGNIQFGYEITSSSGGKNFVTNSFSVTAN